MTREAPRPAIDASVLTAGRWDAWAVLGLRVARRLALLLIPVGLGVAVLSGLFDERLASNFDSVSAYVHALLSPLWLLALGLLLRLAIAPVAYLLALLAALSARVEVVGGPARVSRWSRVMDFGRVAGGLRALRWTTPVRDDAAARLGQPGRLLRVAELTLGWLVVLAWATLVPIVAAHG